MANSDKNIRIQPNRNSTLFPKITFTGQSNNPITLNVLDDNSLSFEGSSGQLFAINNNLSSGYIFSVNDISGLPSFRINADGTVGIAEYYGNVGIGVTNPLYKFHARGDSYFSSTGNTALLLISGTGGTIIASNSVNVTLTDPARKALVLNAATSQTANLLEWYADGGQGLGYSLAGTVRPAGQLHLGSPGLTMSNGGSAILGLQGRGSSEGLAIRGYNSNATNPLFEVQGNAGNQLFGIYGDGGVNAPRINVTNTTGSTSTSTGALIVSGGVGIGGTLNVNNIGIGYTGIPYNPSIAFIGTTGDPIRLSVLSNNTLSFEGSSGQLFSINNNLSSGWIFSVNDISGIPLFRANANANIAMAEYAGNVGIGLSNATFKLQVAGSASIGNTLITDRLKVNSKITFEPGTGTSAVSGWTGIGLTSITRMIYAANRFVGVGGSYVAYSNDGVNFTYTTIPGQTSSAAYGDIAYGNGIFVAVNAQNVNSTAYSYDGASWGTTSIASGLIRSVGFGNGRFLAPAEAGNVVYSSVDGRNWTAVGGLSGYGNETYFANGYFLAVRSGYIFYSKDGVSWKTANTPGYVGIYSVTYGKGIYLAADYNSAQYYTSSDLVNWTRRTIDNKVWVGASYINGVFYLIPNNNNFLHHSLDGINWSTTNFGTPIGGVNKLFTANDRLYFLSSYGPTLWSTDATTGTLMAKPFYNGELENTRIGAVNPDSATFTHLTAFNDVSFTSATASTSFDSGALTVTGGVGIGGTLNVGSAQVIRNFTHTPTQTTIGGASGWSVVTLPSGMNTTSLKYLNNKFVGFGGTYIYYSDDAITWSSVMVPNLDTTRNIASVTYGKGRYVLVQNLSTNAGFSTNLTNWTIFTNIQYQNWFNLEYGNGRFVADAGSYPYASSPDGVTWTMANDTKLGYGQGLTFINGYFYSTNGNSLSRSIDGITWQACNTPALPNGLAYGNGLYVGGVYNSGTIVYSYDGLNFSSYTGTSYVHTGAAFYNGVYYLLTQNNQVLRYSIDGFNWSNSTSFGSNTFNLRYAQGKLWVATPSNLYSAEATPGRIEVNPIRTGNIDDVEIGRLSPNNANFIDVSVNNNLNVSSQYDSASILDGALTVSGGVGIGKTLNTNSARVLNNFNHTPSTGSTGGIVWTSVPYPTIPGLAFNGFDNSVIYGGDKFVGIAGTNVYYSYDSYNWFYSPIASATVPRSITYGNGVYVAINSTGSVGYYSYNGISWSTSTLANSTQNGDKACFGNGKFVYNDQSGYVGISTNGINWTSKLVLSGGAYPYGVDYANGWYFARWQNNYFRSADLNTWTRFTLPADSGRSKIFFSKNKYYAPNNNASNYFVSDDGFNWTTQAVTSGFWINMYDYFGTLYLIRSSANAVSYSEDGINWATASLGGTSNTNATGLVYGNGRFVYIGSNPNLIFSGNAPNGVSHISTPRTSEIDNVRIGANSPASAQFTGLNANGSVNFTSISDSNSLYNGALTVAGGVGIAGTTNLNTLRVNQDLVFTPTTGTAAIAGGLLTANFPSFASAGSSMTRSVAFGNGRFVGVAGTSIIWSEDAINWNRVNNPSTAGAPYFVAYGNNTWVATINAATTELIYSTNNGSSWSLASIPFAVSPIVVYGNGIFIISSGQYTGISTNGINWTSYSAFTYPDRFLNGFFYSKTHRSPDGINWQALNTPASNAPISYGNGLYFAAEYNSANYYISYDGVNFTTTTIGNAVHLNSAYYNGVYYLVTQHNNLVIKYSTDGFNYTNVSYPNTSTNYGIAYGNNKIVLFNNLYTEATNYIYYAEASFGKANIQPFREGTIDNVTIGSKIPQAGTFNNVSVLKNLNVNSNFPSVSSNTGALTVFGGAGIGQTLNVGGSVNVSNSFNLVNTTTGIATTWTRTVVGTGATITYLAYANNLYVGVGYSSLTSTDGINWTTRTLPNNLSYVTFGNGIWSGLLFNSALGATSTNGTTWTSYAMTNSRQWTMMAYGNGVFVTIARSTNIAAYSTNGYNWTEVTLPTTGSPVWVWLTYGGGYFVAVANGSATAVYSSDGINWSTTTLPSAGGWNCVTYGNGYFYVTGSGTGGVYSRDLVNWTPYAHTISGSAFAAYNNGAFVVADVSGAFRTNIITGDFTSRTQIDLPGPQIPTALVAGDRNFIAGYGQTFYTFPIPNNSISVFPNTTGEINNVEIGSVKPASGAFSNIFAQNTAVIGSTVRSTSPYTGALTVVGGVGIGGSLYSGSIFTPGRLQNQSFSGSAVGASDGRMGAYDGAFQYQSTGNGVIVATSWGAYNARYSTDGLNWQSTTLPVNQGYPINFFGNGYFVLSASGSTTILYSTNGSSWSQVSIGNTLPRSSGIYGNGKYVIVGSGSTYNYSTNLTTWNTGTLPLQGDWRIAYGNGMFVAIAYGTNRLIYSYDGVNWNIGNTNSTDRNFMKITYTNGKFMVTAFSTGGTWYSYDGINWFVTSNPGGDVYNVSYGNGVYFSNDALRYTYSSDGFNWSSLINFSTGYESFESVYAFNKFNTVGRLLDGPTNTVTLDPKFTGEINNVRIGAVTPSSGDFTNLSSTGSANLVGTVNANDLNVLSKINQTPVLGGFAGTTGWTSANIMGGSSRGLAFGNGIFVSTRIASNVANFSSDGKRWISTTLPFTGDWKAVAWGNDKFVAVAGLGTSGAYSGNGISWTSMNMPANVEGWYSVTYGDDKFVAVGNTSTAAYSSDGITWSGSSIANTNWTGIAYGNGTFVTVAGYGASSAYSYDGINWNLANLPTTGGGIKFITYGNGYFIVTNYVSTSINYSRDGINWFTSTRSSNSSIHTGLAYGNGVYNALNYAEVSFSYDAINWINSNNIQFNDWLSVAYGNGKFVGASSYDGNVSYNDGPSNTLNLYPKFTGDIDNVRIGAKQPAAAEFTNLAAQQPVRFTANTPSTNITNGALVVLGGVGIGQSLNVGADVTINSGRESNSTSTGALIVRGGVGITGGLYVKPYSLSTKGLVVQANVSQTANLFELQSSASSTLTSFNANGELNITSTTGSTSATTGSIITAGGVGIGGSVSIGSTASSVSTTSGALKVAGGVGISGALNVGGSVNFSTSIFGGVSTSITPTMTFIGQANDPITLSVLADNSLSFDGSSGQLFSINNNLSTGWIFSISDISGLPLFRTNADGTVSMGEFGGNVGIGLTNPSYKLQVNGDAGIANTLFVSGYAHFGTTSYYDTYATYSSPVITVTDNFAGDIGIQIQNKSNDLNARSGINIYNDANTDYFNFMLGSSNYAGIGQSMAFIETNKRLDINFATNMTVRDGIGDILSLSGTAVTVAPTTESTSTTSGSLIVKGGAGIGKSLNVGGYLSSKPAYATAGLAANQTLSTGADNLILFTDNADPNGWWTGTAGSGVSHRFKPNIAGLYFVSLQIHFMQGTGTGQMNIQARKNGNTFSLSRSELTTDASGLTLNLSGTTSLDGNTDYIDFTAYTAGTQNIYGEANRTWSHTTIYKIF